MDNSRESVSLTVPNNTRYLPLVLDGTVSVTRILGLDEKTANEVILGVEEAVVNVINHAFAEGDQASIELVFQEIAAGLQVLIRQQGIPFDTLQLAQLGRKESIDLEDTQGLSLRLMYQYMDEVSFVNRGKAGQETRLVKYLGRTPVVEQRLQDEQNEPAQDMPAYTIRPMLPHEAVEVAKCAYLSYGYSYSSEHIYYPERLRQLNEKGEVVSLVAVSEDNEIIGHIAMFFGDDPLVPVVDDAFVKPRYRGAGCLNDLGAAVIDWATARGLTGTYTWAVTTHTYSQKTAAKWGLSDTAIFLSAELPFAFKGIDEGGQQRESVSILFKYFRPMDPIRLYAPPHHAAIIKEIYEHLDVPVEILHPEKGAAIPDAESVVEVKYDPSLTAFLTVKEYGRSVINEVGRVLRDLCRQRLETIYLKLPLNHPLTALLTRDFEELGFFFCGIMPGSEGRDQLMLQYLNNQVIDYGRVRVITEIGRKILAYIEGHDPNKV